MSPTLKSTGVGRFAAKVWEKWWVDASQILTRRGMGLLSYAKEILSTSGAVSAQYTNVTDKQTAKQTDTHH